MIYLECYPDETLAKSLGIPKAKITHSFSKGNVCNKLEKNIGSTGLVDEDPYSTQPTYIEKLRLTENKEDVKILHDDQSGNRVIILCPNLEEWILKAVTEAKMDISKYGLPNDSDELHKAINTNLKKFDALLAELKQKSRMLKTLEATLKK